MKPNDDELADLVSQRVADLMADLHETAGVPWDCILAGAHAQIIAEIVAAAGGPMTAKLCRHTARRVSSLPSSRAMSLCSMPPAGTA